MTEERTRKQFEGLVCAVATPFNETGKQIDESSLRRLSRFLVEGGVDGLYPCGTTGEFPLLTLSERKRVAEIVIDEVGNEVPVVVHCGAMAPEEVIKLAVHAHRIGAPGVGMITPYFYPLDDLAIEKYFESIALRIPSIPTYLYNIPGYGGNDLSPATAKRIFDQHPQIKGIKYTGTDLFRLRQYLQDIPQAKLFIGCDKLILSALGEGAVGAVSGPCTIVPGLFASLFSAFRGGHMEEASKIQSKVFATWQAFEKLPPIPSLKRVLQQRGVIDHPISRGPLRALTSGEEVTLNQLMEELDPSASY